MSGEFTPRALRKRVPGADFVQPGLQAYRDDFGEVRGYKATLPPQGLSSGNTVEPRPLASRPTTAQPGGGYSGAVGGGSIPNRLPD